MTKTIISLTQSYVNMKIPQEKMRQGTQTVTHKKERCLFPKYLKTLVKEFKMTFLLKT